MEHVLNPTSAFVIQVGKALFVRLEFARCANTDYVQDQKFVNVSTVTRERAAIFQ